MGDRVERWKPHAHREGRQPAEQDVRSGHEVSGLGTTAVLEDVWRVKLNTGDVT